MCRRLVNDQLATNPVSLKSAISRQPVARRRLVGDRLATTELASQPKSAAAGLLCKFIRLASIAQISSNPVIVGSSFGGGGRVLAMLRSSNRLAPARNKTSTD